MTITGIAQFITRKMQKTDNVNVQFCKDAVRGRWEIVWNSRLWIQSRVIDIVTVPAGTVLVSMPAGIDRVVALRYGSRAVLDPVTWESQLKDDPEFYERIGEPRKFIQTGRDGSGNATVRLNATPKVTEDMLVVGKTPFPTCTDDSDSPSNYVDGVDRVLIAFGEGDMLEKQQQWQAAQLKFTEATALLKTMESMQNDQSAQTIEMAASPIRLNETDW